MKTIYEHAYDQGTSLEQFLAGARNHRDLWLAIARRASPGREVLERAGAISGTARVLVLSDDWCGDAINTLPIIAGIVAAAPGLELRIVPRDAFPEVRDRHLTGGSRSIPIAVVLDDEGHPVGSWGPRPDPLQELVTGELRSLISEDRYREVRRWYARDRGQTTEREFVAMLEAAVGSLPKRAMAGAS